MTRPLQLCLLFRLRLRHPTLFLFYSLFLLFFLLLLLLFFSLSSNRTSLDPFPEPSGKMGYTELDQKAINTIRVLAVSCFPWKFL